MKDGSARLRWVTLFALLLVGVAGFCLHRAQGRLLRATVERDLAAVVALKADHIAAFRAERAGDGAVISANAFLAQGVDRWARLGAPADRDSLVGLFERTRSAYGYSMVALIDALGNVRLTVGAPSSVLDEQDRALARSALSRRSALLSDLHLRAPDRQITMDVAAPLPAPANGFVVLCSLPAEPNLNSLVRSWPVPSASAETVLVRREGDSVLFLNDLRRGQKAFETSAPLSATDVPAVRAVLGYEGVVYGHDYAAVPVIAVTKRVPRSDWYLVSKVDQSEALAVWRVRSTLIWLLMILAVAVVGGVGRWAEQRLAIVNERQRLATEAARLASEVRYETTLRGIGDGVIVTDNQGCVVLMNPVAETLTGWPDREARDRPLTEVFNIVNEHTREVVESPVSRVLRDGLVVNLANHTTLIARDGTERPIADSGAPVLDAEGRSLGVVLVFRDQSNERATEIAKDQALAAAQRRERSVRALAQASRAALDAASFEDAARAVIEACRQVTGSQAGLVSLLSEDGSADRIVLLATDGAATPFAADMVLPVRGLRAQAYQQRCAVYSNEFAGSPEAGRLPSDHMPLANVLVAPMATEGRPTGLVLLSNKPGGYTDEDADIASALAEVAALALHRALTADALRSSEATHRALIEGLPDIVERHAQDGRHLFVSPIVDRLLGVKPEQVVGRRHGDFEYPADLVTMWDGAIGRVFESGLPDEAEFVLDTPAGARTYEWRLVPECDGDGSVASVLTVMRDITAQRQAEQTTRQMADLLDAAPNAVLVIDRSGALLYANDAAARIHGYPPEEFLSLRIEQLQTPLTASLNTDRQAILDREGTATFEVEHLRSDGGVLPLEVVSKTIDWSGRTAVLSIATDITQRRLLDKTQLFLIECGSTPGQDFFLDLAEYLATELSADFVCIDELLGDGLTARTLAVWHDGRFEDNVSYSLADTPCGQVAEQGFCWIGEGVRHRFPQDAVLQDLGAESYAGTVLWSSDGRAIGLIAVIWRRPLGRAGLAEAVLKLVGIRAAGELERCAAEQALRDREELLARTGELAHVGGWSVDLSSRQLVWTSETFRIHRLPEGQPPSVEEALAYYSPESRRRLGRAFLKSRRDGRPFDLEADLLSADGARRRVHVVGCRRLGLGGRSEIVGAIQDITARRRNEDALRLRLALVSLSSDYTLDQVLRITLDSIGDILHSPIGFYHFVDPDQKSLTLQMWSTSTERDFCHAEGKGSHYAVSDAGVWADAIRTRRVVVHNDYPNVEGRRGLPEGHAEVVRELVIPIVRDSKVVAVLGVGNKPNPYTEEDVQAATYLADVTWDLVERRRGELERARLEAQLAQAQKMEAVGRLAGGVAHDFNNMLSVILGHLELALDQVSDGELHDDLIEMQHAAQRSAELTRHLLAFARRQAVAPRVVDLNEEVRSSTSLLRRLIGEDIQLLFRPSEPLWPVRIDPAQFYQVMANLLVNSRDAIRDGGSVIIATANASFDADRPLPAGLADGDYVEVTVADSGCGMDAATLANIFEPFFTTKGVGEGTGLGLAMVYGVIKQNNGWIDVTSVVGRGTTFRILLPRWLEPDAAGELTDDDDAPMADDDDGAGRAGTGTILLVEDESAILRVSRRILTAAGYRVLAAGSPSDAIRIAHAEGGEIDLLVTDVIMPEMSGRELAELMVALNPQLAVLYMSGYTADVIARHGVLEAGVHFLQKPFSRAALLANVEAALAPSPPI